jgi:DNA-binding response OmpR family regulator
VSRTDIEAHIYDDRAEWTSNVVDSAICALRRKIDSPGEPSLILTRRRMGYVLLAERPVAGSNQCCGMTDTADVGE